MKTKLIAAIAAFALGLGAVATPEKALTIQITDINGLTKAATKAGELVGYPMLGTLAAMGLADNEAVQMFGAPRNGENGLFVIYADPEKITGENSLEPAFTNGDLGIAFIFAPTKSKQDFLLTNKDAGAEEKDGVISLAGMSIAYAEDGKWVAVASSPDFAKTALTDAADAQKPMDDDVLRFNVKAPAIKIASVIFKEAAAKNPTDPQMKSLLEGLPLLEMIDSYCVGMRINDAGLDCRGKLCPVAGSELSKFALKSIEGDAFAGIPDSSIYTVVGAEGAGSEGEAFVKLLEGLVGFFKEGGCDTSWFKREGEGTVAHMTLDLPAAIKYFTGEGKEAVDKLDPEKFIAKYYELAAECNKCSANSKPFKFSLAFAGVQPTGAQGAVFAKTLPEAADKKPAMIGLYRCYSAIKALAPLLAEFAPEEVKSMINAAVATLPADDDAAIAMVQFRDGDALGFLARISANEIRGFAAIANVCIATMGMSCSDTICEEYEDEDDDDDDADSAVEPDSAESTTVQE